MRQTPIYFYSSKSGMAKQFALALNRPVFDLSDREVRKSIPDGPWVLLTPSYKTGNAENDTIPEPVRRFLRSPEVRRKMIGVMGSGNRNFGSYYQAAARDIAKRSGRPIIFEFELQGTQWDVEDAVKILEELDSELEKAHKPGTV